MKTIATVIFLVIIAVCIDSTFRYLSFPVVTTDLIFVPFSIFLIGWVFSPGYLSGRYISWDRNQAGAKEVLGVVFGGLITLVVGLLMIYFGFSDPMELHVGPRGSGHGYTLFILGLAMICFILSTTYVTIRKSG